MDIRVELHKLYLGHVPTCVSDTVNGVPVREYFGKVNNWHWLDVLGVTVKIHSSGSCLDLPKGPRYVLAKVSNHAANILLLSKGAGWYVTDVKTDSF